MTKRQVLCLASVLVLPVLFAEASANARNVASSVGRPQLGANLSCFSIATDIGWVSNPSCSNPYWEIPLPVENTGAKTVTMTVWAPNTNDTFCRSRAAAKNGTSQTGSAFIHPSLSGTDSDLSLTSAVVPSTGMLWVDCQVGAGASLSMASYTP